MGTRVFAALLAAVCVIRSGAPAAADSKWSMGAPIVTYVNYSPRGYQLKGDPCGYNRALEAVYGWPRDYEPTNLTEAIARQAVEGGFNLVWISDPAQLPIAEAHGLRAQLLLSGSCIRQNAIFATNVKSYPGDCVQGNWRPECWPLTEAPSPYTNRPLTEYLDALIDSFKSSPAAYSYYLADEPCEYSSAQHQDLCASKLLLLGAISDYIRKRDPAHLVYVNLLPQSANLADIDAHSTRYPDYAAFIADYVSKVHPTLLSFDSYNLKLDKKGRPFDDIQFITDTQAIARASVRHGIPFMAIAQGQSNGADSRVPVPAELAFLVNTTLAFGAQGISYFNYWRGLDASVPWACRGGPDCGAMAPFPDGSPTSVFSAAQRLNPVFRKIATHLRGLDWMGTYLKGYARPPTGVSSLPVSATFDIPALHDTRRYSKNARLEGALLGMFGIAGKVEFAYVVNLDYSAAHTFSITGPARLSRFDAASDKWIQSGKDHVDLTLAAGDGALVGLTENAEARP